MGEKYGRMSLSERVEIEKQLSHQHSYSKIGSSLGRSKSSIQREVAPYGKDRYSAVKAQQYADKSVGLRKMGKVKIKGSPALQAYIEAKLQLRWSPVQISQSLKAAFANDKAMHLSHESIYQYIYLHAKKGIREALKQQLRQKKKNRGQGVSKATDKRGKIADAVSIDERPAEVQGRAVPGHWEGDLIVGKGHQSAIGTLVERTTRTIILVPLTGMDAETVRLAFEQEFASVPQQMKQTLTYDNGREMSGHKTFTTNTQIKVYFTHPYSPWERPTNENSNGLVRDYFPKGTDFSQVRAERLKEVQEQLNTRPRKVLGFKTPKDVFEQMLIVPTTNST